MKQIDIHEHVHVFKQHAFMKLKRNLVLERLLYGFCVKNRSSTSMDEVEELWKFGKNMKIKREEGIPYKVA